MLDDQPEQTDFSKRDFNSYHEAGHLVILILCNVPFKEFAWFLENQDAEVRLIYSAEAKYDAVEWYCTFLSIRAAAYSQKLCPDADPTYPAQAIVDDVSKLKSKGVAFYKARKLDFNSLPDEQAFLQALEALADKELDLIYQNPAIQELSRRCAAYLRDHYTNTPIPQVQLKTYVEEQEADLVKAGQEIPDLTYYKEFRRLAGLDKDAAEQREEQSQGDASNPTES